MPDRALVLKRAEDFTAIGAPIYYTHLNFLSFRDPRNVQVGNELFINPSFIVALEARRRKEP